MEMQTVVSKPLGCTFDTVAWKRLDCKFYTVSEMSEVSSYGEWEWNRSTYCNAISIYNIISGLVAMDLHERDLSIYYIELDGKLYLPAADCEFDCLSEMPMVKFVLMKAAGMICEIPESVQEDFRKLVSKTIDHNTERPHWLIKMIEEGKANIDNWKC